MLVECEHMVDLGDKLANNFIYSDKVINFLSEWVNLANSDTRWCGNWMVSYKPPSSPGSNQRW